ncbi:MAG: metal ABC transporter solute-binding protein, Zn/Mn family [Candidatus Woesearchaeota archaeon]
MRYILLLMVLLTSLFLLTGCQQALVEESESDDTITIVTSLFPLYDFAKQVGGDKVSVTLLLPPGAEAHSFDPRPSDILKLEQADMFIFIGEDFETWAHSILESLGNQNLVVIEAMDHVHLIEDGHEHHHEEHTHEGNHTTDYDHHDEHETTHANDHHDEEHDDHIEDHHNETHSHSHDHHHGDYDPHIWLDLHNAEDIVKEIARQLIALSPEHEAHFTANKDAYVAELEALDDRFFAELATCEKDEFLVGGHNFFGYIEHRYGVTGIAAIDNLEPNAEPTPQRIAQIATVAQEHNISYILTEVLVGQRMAEAIAEEVGASILQFHPLESISRDDFERGKTFIEGMSHNLEVLKTALQCS